MLEDATMAPTSPERDWMTPDEFRDWYVRLKRVDKDLTHEKLARHLEVTQPTIGRWLRDDIGRGKPGEEAKGRRIEHGAMLKLALERLEQILIEEQKPKRRRSKGAPQ